MEREEEGRDGGIEATSAGPIGPRVLPCPTGVVAPAQTSAKYMASAEFEDLGTIRKSRH